MKKNLLILVLVLLTGVMNAQFFQIADTLTIQHADILPVDIDGDNDFDIIVSGISAGIPMSHIYTYEDGVYTYKENPVITPGHFADIKAGDIDGDGTLDIIFNGNSNDEAGRGIALNDGSGNFTLSDLDVTNATLSCGFADFNNDGYVDYFVWGNHEDAKGTIFFNNQDGTFTGDGSSFDAYTLIDPDVTLVDINNDGSIDIFVSGWDKDNTIRFSKTFINDGNGNFSELAQPNIIRKGFGSSTWGDVDGDGWMDLLLNGDGGADGEDNNWTYRLYKNNNGTLEEKATFVQYRQISVGDGARMVDWDNDGDLDIILTGWSPSKSRQVTMMFECTDAASFTFVENSLSNTEFPGVSESSIETADLNQDGKIDLLISGFNGNQEDQVGQFNKRICGYYLNQSPNANTKPTTPASLSTNIDESGEKTIVTLSWNAASDTETPANSLTYNVALKNTTTGEWLYNPLAAMGGEKDGWRKIPAHGNVFGNTSWELNGLPDGSYEWTVQSIDANFEGSTFAAAETFNLETTGITGKDENVAKIYSFHNKIRVELPVNVSNANVSVFSITGALVLDKSVNSIFEREFNSGIYIVRVSAENDSWFEKVVVK